MTIRPLAATDAAALERFLAPHRDSSMFLRSNMRRGGLEFRGEPFQAQYLGAFADEQLVGVAAHCWNGVLLVQAPERAGALAAACVRQSGRPLTGLSGPLRQVREAMTTLHIDPGSIALDGHESLYALDLRYVRVPEALRDGSIVCRPPRPDEWDLLRAWRLAYDIEVLGGTEAPETRRRSAEFLDAQIAEGHAWVALHGGRVVSLSALNAALPDVVQLGGIYTPPELRGRGYAKAAVAATLLDVRDRGASRAVLFTQNPSAIRSYQALGFERTGEYALVLLKTPPADGLSAMP